MKTWPWPVSKIHAKCGRILVLNTAFESLINRHKFIASNRSVVNTLDKTLQLLASFVSPVGTHKGTYTYRNNV